SLTKISSAICSHPRSRPTGLINEVSGELRNTFAASAGSAASTACIYVSISCRISARLSAALPCPCCPLTHKGNITGTTKHTMCHLLSQLFIVPPASMLLKQTNERRPTRICGAGLQVGCRAGVLTRTGFESAPRRLAWGGGGGRTGTG